MKQLKQATVPQTGEMSNRDIEATKHVLRQKIGELEERQDEEEEGSMEWESLESEQCDLETALVRMERGIELGAYPLARKAPSVHGGDG